MKKRGESCRLLCRRPAGALFFFLIFLFGLGIPRRSITGRKRLAGSLVNRIGWFDWVRLRTFLIRRFILVHLRFLAAKFAKLELKYHTHRNFWAVLVRAEVTCPHHVGFDSV